MSERSRYELAFETRLRQLGDDLAEPQPEFVFDDARQWRFDFAWIDDKVAVEIDGGNHLVRYSKKLGRHVAVGRHTQSRDYDKINEATIAGWKVLRFTGEQVLRDYEHCIKQVRRLIKLPFDDFEMDRMNEGVA